MGDPTDTTGPTDPADLTELHRLGVADLLAGYRSGRFGPVAVVDACLARLTELQPVTGAVVTMAADRARSEAAASERRWRRGRAGPLDGIPFGVKDNIATAGVRTTAGWSRLDDWVPDTDATAVARLRGAGAVMTAKLATPELAFGDAREGHRPTNPWSVAHWTGGSSSGPAVALAARLLPLALGTDTGGSIRVPSSYCGVTGLKPTAGRVPRDRVVMVSSTLDHTGPMARSAVDLGLALSVLAGHAAADPHSAADPVVDTTALDARAVDGLRIGVPRPWFQEQTAGEVLAATEAAVAVLADLGATTGPVDLPDPQPAGLAAWVVTVAEFASFHPGWQDHVDDYTPSAAERLAAGTAMSAGDYLRALHQRAELQAAMTRVFEQVDVLVTPATPTAAPRIAPPADPMFGEGDGMWLERVARNLIMWNLVGLPAVVVPAGFTDDGRPLAVQVVGPPFAERRILDVAAAYQAATTHHRRPPTIEGRAGVSAAGGGHEMRPERRPATTS